MTSDKHEQDLVGVKTISLILYPGLKTYVSFIRFFVFWFLVTFGDEVTKIHNYYGIFVFI